MLQQLEQWLQFDFQIKMASHLLRKRRQAVSPSKRLQKYLRAGWSQTENDDFQENFCVYCNCERDDRDCVVVSEKIVKERGRCQNPACMSGAAVKLQRASRRIQEFYGHSYREGQLWKICKVCYLRAEQHLEELIPVEINCTSEDDNSYDDDDDDDDVIVLETVQSLHNHSDALTKRQPNVGEVRTFVKFSGENSFSSIKTDVMNGSIVDKGNTDVPRALVHSNGTSDTLEVSNTKKSGRELSQNHQAFSQGDVTECTPVQYVPFQQLLQQGLSVFGAQSGIADYQEGLENKQQQPSTQPSKGHINEQESVELHHTLQERFCVLNPSTTTDFGQEKQQESLQLQQQLQHQNPGIQHSTSLAHRHFDGPRTTKSSSCNITHISEQISEQVFQKTCVLESATPQMLNGHPATVSYPKQDEENVACEQCIQLVAPLTIGSTPPLPNNQQEDKSQFLRHSNEQNVLQTVRSHNEHIISKDMSHHDSQTVCQHQQLSHEQSVQQNSTLFFTPTLLQQGGQHVISGVQDSRAENTQKQSIQQTASEMSSSPSEKCLLCPPHPAGQSLVSTQQQPSELASQPVQQHSGQCNQQSVSLSPQQSSEDIALKITNQYSGQIMVQISGLCNQKCTPQSVHSEPRLLTQQPQQQKKQAESHITLAMEIQNQREMGNYLQMTRNSNVPTSPLISSKPVCMNLCMTVEPPETQGPIISELGLNQLERQQQKWQQKQNTPSSILQEPQEHILTAESDTDSRVESALLSVSNRDLLQNRYQPLQHLENSQSEQIELKLEPVIPLQKSQEGNPQYSDKQVSSSGSASQLVYQQLCASLTNNIQMVECVSQPSVVCQFPGHLSVMCQEQQVKMFMGFTCDILAQFLPTVMQQQLQNDSDKAEVAPSLMKTDEQILKAISNPDDLRLPDEEENEISDTESVCQSLADSLTSNLSSTESDRSVSDFTGGCAEKDVVPLGNVIIEESHLPPLGMLYRPPVAVGDSVYVMNDIKRPWVLGTVQDIASKINKTLYTVECLNSKNRRLKKTIKEATGYQLAYPKVQDFRFSVGHRIISIFRNGNSDEEYYSGVIAESPKSINHYRYLVFFDKGSYQYVKHEDICLVVDGSQSMWEAVPKETRDFVQNYLEKYPERAMLKVQGGQHVSTEWNGIWYNAKVIEVDASLALMSFPPKGKYVEWIYRGSPRFYPLFEARNRTCKKQFARTRAFARKVCAPYIQYTVKDEEELDRKIKEERESAMGESEPPYHFTARMNTSSQITAQNLLSAVTPPKRKFYPCYSQVTYKAHICKPSCLVAGSSEKDYGRYQNLWSHLSEPLLYGWTREKVKYSNCVCVYYRAPCKSRLRNIEELHKYLLRTKSKLTVDQFDFNHWVRCFSELINEESFIKIEDISNGVEAVPVPCINTVDSRVPDKIMYVTKHVPTDGTYIETDPEFLTCCNCTDDCLDKEKCACWRQTLEGVKYGPKTESLSNEGYYYKRLYEPLGTGIYECNSRCKCSSTCLNRLVQLPMKCKTQIFMTSNRGWGVRTLHDIPKGSYICLYAGRVLPEKVGDALAEEDGDEYQADLNYIEDAEKIKEYYEENPYENELEVLCGKRPNSKRKGQTTTSRKLTGKMYKIVTPSTRVLFGRNARYILDAKTCGNVGRFINHSCNPNLFVQNVFVDTHDLRFPFVAFFTNSFVPANTELTWNYGYDVGSVPGRTIICKCGESNCQGRLL